MSKQRLIDANALIQEINGYFRPIDESKPMTLTVGQIEEVLDIMQTIEPPVVRGHYLDEKECSECGAPPNRYEMPSGKPSVNWCWNCGAKMGG